MKKDSVILLFSLALLVCLSQQSTTNAYMCEVDNCQTCSFLGVCGLCANNYMLQYDYTTGQTYCEPVACQVTQCLTCYSPNSCAICKEGYSISNTGSCTQTTLPVCNLAGCLSCNSTTSCGWCAYGYNLQSDGECYPNIGIQVPQCMSYFTAYACQLCQPNWIISTSYSCIKAPTFSCQQLANCTSCTSATTCLTCENGFYVSNGNCVEYECTIENCQTCSSSTACSQCMTGYQAVENTCVFKSYACNVANCQACLYSPENCVQCAPGYTSFGSSTTGTTCMLTTGSVANCLMYGQQIFLTSSLNIGCIQCQNNFVLVGGYCVANISLGSYACNIDNCVYCVLDNMCGQCAQGYTVFIGSTDMCVKNYSPLTGCSLTPLTPSTSAVYPICQVCQSGYVLTAAYQCMMVNPEIACNIVGCEFCIADNECFQPRTGYTLTEDNTCTPSCQVEDCFTCNPEEAGACMTCSYGYILDDNNTCLNASTTEQTCPSTVTNCESCNALSQCTSCSTGFVSNLAGGCCAKVVQNVAYCQQYESPCSNTCVKCQKGTFQMSGLTGATTCLGFPCPIANCAYCYNSNTCLVCSVGYTLQNGACTSYTLAAACSSIPYCASCNTTATTPTCSSCVNGYLLYNNTCVCNFQNCLQCQGSAFCTECAFPTIAPIIGGGGCIPEVNSFVLCAVANCQQCGSVNMCSLCDAGYSLNSTGCCVQNVCDNNKNCLLCSVNQDICFLPKQGYIQSTLFGPNTTAIPANYSCNVLGCAVCSSSSQCAQCLPFYNLNRGLCDPISCTDNCVLCYETNNCTVCDFTYYLTSSFTCAPVNSSIPSCGSIDPYCISCETTTSEAGVKTNQCLECYFGLMPNAAMDECVPLQCTDSNCNLCLYLMATKTQMCMACEQGFFLNSYFLCVAYSPAIATTSCSGIYNCLYCAAQDYCSFCVLNWNNTNGVCSTDIPQFCSGVQNCQSCSTPSFCTLCAANYTQSSLGACTPLCNITNCMTCGTLTTCATCNNTFVSADTNTACVCPDDTFTITASACGCPGNTTFYATDNTCVNCTGIANCTLCQTANVCATCASPFIVDTETNTCVCAPTFTAANNSCECPTGSPLNSVDNKCYECSTANCLYCSSTANTCAKCTATFQLQSDNTCICGASFLLNSTSNTCYCASGQLENIAVTPTVCLACNITECSYCSAANVCAVCLKGYTVNPDNTSQCICATGSIVYQGSCILCNSADNCLACSAPNVCATCVSTYTLNATSGTCYCNSTTTLYLGTCYVCPIQGCSLCKANNVCSTCVANQYSLQGSTCIPCMVNNCTSCSSPNYCSNCASGLKVSASGSSCLTCSITNCVGCVSNNKCGSCASGFQLSASQTQCLTCNVQGCMWCANTADTCTQCQTGYTLSGNTCTVCSAPCATCSTTFNATTKSNCLSCMYPFSSVAASNSTCYTCNIANCMTCPSDNANTCSACRYGYVLSSSKDSCIYASACPTTCDNCAFNQSCQACTNGYTLSLTNSTDCLQCSVSNCATCSPTDTSTCRLCATNYYLVGGLCIQCPFSNCATCTATACLTFTGGQVAINQAGIIVPAACDPNCLSCSSANPAFCLVCATGYALSTSTGFCVTCAPSCLTCSTTNSSQCLSCYSNAVLSSTAGTCTACNSNCLTCTAALTTSCTSCHNGYWLNMTSNACVQGCPSNCITCSSAKVCTLCAVGFSANSAGVCLPCLSNCKECSGSAQAVCLGCGVGFYLASSSASCAACPLFCSSCSSSSICNTCMSGYSLNSSQLCVANCAWPCATCASNSTSSCNSCLAGYTIDLTTSTCTPDLSCSDNNGICYTCPLGSVLKDNACVNCTTTSCARCSPTTPATCYSCMSGSYLSTSSTTNTCMSCPTGCSTCSSATNCQSCSAGYTFNTPVSSGVQNVCVLCELPCNTCSGNPTSCTSCTGSFTLNGWQCISNFRFAFMVSLNTNLTTFYDNYYSFLLALMAPLSSTALLPVSISSIVASSVNVTGSISTTQQSGSNGVATQYYGVQDVLKSSSIAGMPILSSTLISEGGDIPAEGGVNTLAIILGVCIPVGIILIGVIVYFVCLRNRNNSPPVVYENSGASSARQTFELTRDEPTL